MTHCIPRQLSVADQEACTGQLRPSNRLPRRTFSCLLQPESDLGCRHRTAIVRVDLMPYLSVTGNPQACANSSGLVSTSTRRSTPALAPSLV